MRGFGRELVACFAMLFTPACAGSTADRAAPTRTKPHGTSGSDCPDAGIRCGDACCAGHCVAGRCPTVLVTQDGFPTAMAVAAGNLVWITAYDVMGVPVEGGTPASLAGHPPQLSGSGSLAVDSGNAYWTNFDGTYVGSSAVEKISLDGTTRALIASFTLTGNGLDGDYSGYKLVSGPHGLAVDATNVYFLRTSPDGLVTTMKVPSNGGTSTQLASELTNSGIAVDAVNLYGFDDTGALLAVPLAGGPPTVLVPPRMGQSRRAVPVDLAVDATSVYWSDTDPYTTPCCSIGNDRIWKVPTHGGPPTLLASGQSGIGAITVDETSVYWVARDDRGTGLVMKVSIDGGAPTLLGSSEQLVTSIAVDETSVYWNESTTVVKLTPK